VMERVLHRALKQAFAREKLEGHESTGASNSLPGDTVPDLPRQSSQGRHCTNPQILKSEDETS
jgi:hypothetical protein